MTDQTEIKPEAEAEEQVNSAPSIATEGLYAGMDEPALSSPLESEPTPIVEPEPEAGPEYFIGDAEDGFEKQQVLDLLKLAQGIPEIVPNAQRTVNGHLGPIVQRLEKLQKEGLREWAFDPEQSPGLKKLRTLDGGIGDAMADLLGELKVNSLDVGSAVAPILDERLGVTKGEVWDQVQDDMLLQFVPDAFEVGPSEEFTAFMKTQPPEVQEVLQQWGQEGSPPGSKNARAAIGAFMGFKELKEKEAAVEAARKAEEEGKQAALRRSVEDGKSMGGTGTPSALGEQEALDARMKESGSLFNY